MFEPVNELERLLIAAATDPAARNAFTAALLDAEVFISPAGDPPTDGSLGDIVVSHPEGLPRPAAAVFTAAQRVAEVVGPEARVWGWNGRTLFTALNGQAVHLNPNLTPQVVWTGDDIKSLLATRSTVAVPAGSQMMLTRPREAPTQLLAELTRTLSAEPSVKAAFLLQADHGGQRVWLLGVEHDGPWTLVDKAIGTAVIALGPMDQPLQATALSDNSLSRELRRGIPIVAPKKRFGLF